MLREPQGLPAGVVEAANKMHQRRAGMRWSGDVLTFRAMSGRAAWQAMTHAANQMPDVSVRYPGDEKNIVRGLDTGF